MTDISELVQRARINAECGEHLSPAETLELVDALEKSQRYIERLREWNAGLAQESCERQQRIAELESRAVAVTQLAAENVALKESRNNLAEFIHEELDADYPLNMNMEIPATDSIVAGIKADGVEEFAAYISLYNSNAEHHALNFAKQLREDANQ